MLSTLCDHLHMALHEARRANFNDLMQAKFTGEEHNVDGGISELQFDRFKTVMRVLARSAKVCAAVTDPRVRYCLEPGYRIHGKTRCLMQRWHGR